MVRRLGQGFTNSGIYLVLAMVLIKSLAHANQASLLCESSHLLSRSGLLITSIMVMIGTYFSGSCNHSKVLIITNCVHFNICPFAFERNPGLVSNVLITEGYVECWHTFCLTFRVRPGDCANISGHASVEAALLWVESWSRATKTFKIPVFSGKMEMVCLLSCIANDAVWLLLAKPA